MTRKEEELLDSLAEVIEELEAARARLAQLEKMTDVVRLDGLWQELVAEKDRYKTRLDEAVELLHDVRDHGGTTWRNLTPRIDAFLARENERE